MRWFTVVTLAALLVVSGVSVTAIAQEEPTAPGAKFAGVVGVQGAEVEGEVADRALDERLSRADSNTSKAAVIATEQERLSEKLDRLERREERLRAARANGSVSEGAYRAQMAELAAESRALERRANRTATVARGLPTEVLRDRGINVSAIERLRTNAADLSGGDTAAIAREIAGEGVGSELGGPPARAENETADRGPPGGDDSEDSRQGDDADAGRDQTSTETARDGSGEGERTDSAATTEDGSRKGGSTETPTPGGPGDDGGGY